MVLRLDLANLNFPIWGGFQCGPDEHSGAGLVPGKQTWRQRICTRSILGSTLGPTPVGEAGLGTGRSWAGLQPQQSFIWLMPWGSSEARMALQTCSEWEREGEACKSMSIFQSQDAGCPGQGTYPWVRQLKAIPGEDWDLRPANWGIGILCSTAECLLYVTFSQLAFEHLNQLIQLENGNPGGKKKQNWIQQ